MNIRRPTRATTTPKDGPKSNNDIRSSEVQLIDAEGINLGVVSTAKAKSLAEEAGLDLVEIVPNAVPPVCKIIDLGKLKYQNQKKASEARKKQKTVDLKEIKLRPTIDKHDYEVKLKSMKRIFSEGDKIKLSLRFRGREIAHQDIGMQLLQKIKTDTEDMAKVELEPKMEGRQMIMILAPK